MTNTVSFSESRDNSEVYLAQIYTTPESERTGATEEVVSLG